MNWNWLKKLFGAHDDPTPATPGAAPATPPAPVVDPRDAELAALRAQIAAKPINPLYVVSTPVAVTPTAAPSPPPTVSPPSGGSPLPPFMPVAPVASSAAGPAAPTAITPVAPASTLDQWNAAVAAYARGVGFPEYEIPNLQSYGANMNAGGPLPTPAGALQAYVSAVGQRNAQLAQWQRDHDAWASGNDASLYDISAATVEDALFLYRHGELMSKVRPGLFAQQLVNWIGFAGPKPRADLPDSHPWPFEFDESKYAGPLRALF